MDQAASGILKIVIFLFLGVLFRKKAVLNQQSIEGLKKIILYLAIPAILFLSFSRLDFNLSFLPVTAAVFSINFIMFWFGVLIYKLSGSKHRLLPLSLSTMNFALLGIPLYEAVYGIENLHHYTVFGVGNEIFIWFVFYFMFRWFLSTEHAESSEWKSFFKTPVIWGIILGCMAGLFKIDITTSENFIVSAISDVIVTASKLTTPLILVFVGFNISLSSKYTLKSLKYVLLRLTSIYALGYLIKFTVIDRFFDPSMMGNAAYFLLLSLPPVFSLPILADEYLESDEHILLNNVIVLHAVITIVLFSVYSIFVN
jgi:malate permease and related proteins